MKQRSVNHLKKSQAVLRRAMMWLGKATGEYPTEVVDVCHILSDLTQLVERIDLVIRNNDNSRRKKPDYGQAAKGGNRQ